MMTAVKQRINAVLMYLYLRWYDYKLRNDQRFMFKELHAALAAEVRK